MSMNGTLPTPEDIKRVKGLGFLHDKTTADCFNARVITRNGRLQPDEIRAIVDAAEKFGSGEIAMTTRLVLMISATSVGLSVPAAAVIHVPPQ